jgi:hypothetical protein
MPRLLYVRRIAAALALCSLGAFLVGFGPFLSVASVGPAASGDSQGFSVNRFRKGDRLPVHPSGALWRNRSVPDRLQSQEKAPFGCDPAFSPVTSPKASLVYGRCMA